MLNRRHLRIKGFQALYAYQQAETKDVRASEKQLLKAIQTVHDFYIYLLLLGIELADFEESAVTEKGTKFLPTEADLSSKPIIVNNKFIQLLRKDKNFLELVNKYKVNWNGEEVLFRAILEQLKGEEAYQNYATSIEHSIKEDQEFILFLYKKVLFTFPLLEQHLEEKNINWPVDQESIEGMVTKTIKAYKDSSAEKIDLLPITANWEDDKEFIITLFNKTVSNDKDYSEMIANKTQNWDVERIAMVDTILMKMAIAELIHFNSIPIKVTMNEYIDISKEFSTPKSKGFINGILDKILVDLKNEKLINKMGRGLLE